MPDGERRHGESAAAGPEAARPSDGRPRDHARWSVDEVDDPARRRFLVRVSLWLSGAIAGLAGLPILGYLLGPLIAPPGAQWIEVGRVDEFPVGGTVLRSFSDISPLPWAGSTAATAVYVQRPQGQDFRVFAVNCTHLGCPVNWLDTARIFVCPCHGGVFYGDGNVAAGPPQHPLYEYGVRVGDGLVYVQTMPLPPGKAWQPPRLPRVTQ